MAANFFQAAIPEPHTILGLRLNAFSAGHIILLNRLQNAFVQDDEPAADSDLFTALWICSRSFEDGLACLHRAQDWSREMGEWIKTYIQKFGPIDFPKKCAAFRAYMKAGSTTPIYEPRRTNGITLVVQLPLVQIVKVALQRDLGLTEAQILDRPWGWSLWDWITLKGMAGDGSVREQEAESVIEQTLALAQHIADKLDKQEKKPRRKKSTRQRRRNR